MAVEIIKPHEAPKPGGQHGELEIQTAGFDEALTSGEKCAAYEIGEVLRLYSLPEKKP